MITFDRQAGPFQNFSRSRVMVIGRSVSFSDPARPPGRPKHPKIPPNIFVLCVRFRTPGTFLKTKFSKKQTSLFCVLRPQEHFLTGKLFSVNKILPQGLQALSSSFVPGSHSIHRLPKYITMITTCMEMF